jgi:hypothetical protein
MILHVSKNGNKIKEAYEVYDAQPGEILLFMEDNEGDFSDQILRIKVANDVRERLKDSILYSDNVVDYVNRNFPLDPALLKQLVEKGYVEEGFTFSRNLMGGLHYAMRVVSAPSKAVGWIVTKIGEGVELLTIPDSIWDTESEDYFLKKENVIKDLSVDISFLDQLTQKLQDDQTKLQANDFIPDFITENLQKFLSKLRLFLQKYNAWVEQTVDGLYKSFEDESGTIEGFSGIPEAIAFYVGIWNGLIDFIASTLKFFGAILEAPFNLSKDRQEMLESVDSMFDMLAEINLSDVVEAFSAIYTKIKTFFKDSSGEGYNYVHIAYAVGFGIAFVGTFFIPFTQLAKFANLQKISKIIPANFFKDLSGVVSKSTTHLAGKTKNAYLNSLKLFEQLLAVFAIGKASITAFLEKIWKKIAAWLVKNKKAFSHVEKVDNAMLPLIRILNYNVAYKKCVKLVKADRYFGRWMAIESEAMIKLYTANTYIRLNKALRGFGGIKLNRELKAMQKVLDDALSKLPISRFNKQVLQRSVYFTEEEIKRLFRVGHDFVEKGFFSTTYSTKALHAWLRANPADNVIFKLTGKNGKLIEEAAFLSEAEVLFKSGTKFVVKSVKEIQHPLDRTKKIIEIILLEK